MSISPLSDPMVYALFVHHRERAPKALVDRLLPMVVKEPRMTVVQSATGEVVEVDFPVRNFYPVFRLYPTVEDVLVVVGRFYRVTPDEILSPSRKGPLIWPRQVAMYLATLTTNKSLLQLGRSFRRDHTSIIHARNKARRAVEGDARFADEVEILRAQLAQRLAARNQAAA